MGEAPQSDDWYLVGIITAPFGVRGEVRIEVVTEFPNRFARLQSIYLGPEHRPVRLERAHTRGKHGVALKLAGYDTPEQAATLRGIHLYVPRSEAVALPEGHYYVDQIIGLQVRLMGGRVIGRVRDIMPLASNDVYVVDATPHGEILVPAIRDVVRDIDIAAGYLTIEPMPGLLPPGLE